MLNLCLQQLICWIFVPTHIDEGPYCVVVHKGLLSRLVITRFIVLIVVHVKVSVSYGHSLIRIVVWSNVKKGYGT